MLSTRTYWSQWVNMCGRCQLLKGVKHCQWRIERHKFVDGMSWTDIAAAREEVQWTQYTTEATSYNRERE